MHSRNPIYDLRRLAHCVPWIPPLVIRFVQDERAIECFRLPSNDLALAFSAAISCRPDVAKPGEVRSATICKNTQRPYDFGGALSCQVPASSSAMLLECFL